VSLPLIKPVLPHGKLASRDAGFATPADYASWTDWDTSDIVDADVIQSNWSVIFGRVNGNLNGSDLDTASATRTETVMLQDWESGNKLWPTYGARHSHDGVDSATLETGIIGSTLMGSLAFGVVRHPSTNFNGLYLYSMAVADRVQDFAVSGTQVSYRLAIPYNYYQWTPGDAFLYRANASFGTSRFFVCPVYTNYSEMSDAQKRGLVYPTITLGVYGGKVDSVAAEMRDTGGVAIPAGWEMHVFVMGEVVI
jgi:hypothetical protein